MIYKNITFKADPFSYDLEFEDRITLVGGDSGTGKTVLYEMLEDIRLTDEYKTIKLFNYKSDDFLKAIKQCRDSFIVVDNAEYSRDPIDWPPCSSAAFRRSIGRPALVTVRPGASGMGGSAGMGVTSPDQSVILGATCATGGAPFPPL